MFTSLFFHRLIPLLILSIAANLDNLGTGIAFGLIKKRIPAMANFFIALISTIFTYLAMVFGKLLEWILPPWEINELGALIIISVGFWIFFADDLRFIKKQIYSWLAQYLPSRSPQRFSQEMTINPNEMINFPKPAYLTQSGLNYPAQKAKSFLGFKKNLLIGLSLSINAMAGGLGATLSGYNPLLTSLAIGIFSYLTIATGQKLSRTYFSRWLGLLAPRIAGILLMLLGVYELFN